MEVDEADEGRLALVVPPVGDVTLNRKRKKWIFRMKNSFPKDNVMKQKTIC